MDERKLRSLERIASLLENIYTHLAHQQLEDAIHLYEKVASEQSLYDQLEVEMKQVGIKEESPEVKELLVKTFHINKKIEFFLNNQLEEITRNQKQNDQMKEASRAYSIYEEREEESYFIDYKK
ncbi:hypothetical protein [Brevibacillus invocatus]|uniref:hypothetical protein n=1 Tax=Brevibacillus invocatus TaxID=173959 RepID=UPI00203A457F|nr:hypothetical protein [Brevibacillus invocatus]MCM3079658.1 hypothetical protein [Brevibacillus invocatus]MCM3431132.1 hypothetical protein [Brevibacillus invocatus]